MALVKSLYINIYIIALLSISLMAGLRYTDNLNVGWLGTLLTTVPTLLMLLSFVLLQNRPRTSRNLIILLGLAVIGAGLSTYKYLQGSGPEKGFILAYIGLVSLFIYVFWYSRLERDESNLQLNRELPEFTLEDEDGKKVHSKGFIGKPTIFLFFRGNWCPLCMAQIKEIAEQYQEITRLGARVALISPQPHKQTRNLAEKFDVDMEFFVDKDLAATKTLGLLNRFGTPMGLQLMGYNTDTVLPTVIITDSKGKIIFLDETDNYRVRPEPSTFLEVLKKPEVQPAQ
ncbi:MAG: redoxin domain-containing protein [Sphingomonadales bacterium]|jgi:peroxiredoxin